MTDSDRTGRVCVFCGGKPVSSEHVWSDWITKLFAQIGTVNVNFTWGASWKTAKLDLRVNRVCTRCNNDWMNDLETQVRPFLEPMVLGKPVVISPADQHALAQWAMKTFLMHDLCHPDDPLPLSQFRSFFHTRTPPTDSIIWVAAYGGRKLAAQGLARGLAYTRRPAIDLPPETAYLYLGTFLAGAAMFQLLMHVGGGNAVPPVRSPFRLRAFRGIWPPLGEPISWPPSNVAFDNGAFQAVMRGVDLFGD